MTAQHRPRVAPPLRERLDLLARELLFRAVCRHRQGERPNILLYCTRRGGSTWLLNAMSAHPGMRYVGRPFLSVQRSRWWRRVPDLAAAAGATSDHPFRQVVHFEGEAEEQFRALARDVVTGRLVVYPSLAFRAPYFQRRTDRIVFQMTSGQPLIEWFDRSFDVGTAVLFRHPIPCARSIASSSQSQRHDCEDFLLHEWFADTYLTGEQMDLARRVLDEPDPLAHQVLDWTLKMLVPFRVVASGTHPAWCTITYEQMVTDPEPVLAAISTRLDLPDADAMRAQLARPSRTVTRTTESHLGDPEYLLARWRRDVPPPRERALLEIPHAFGVDLYEPGRLTAADRFSV